MLTICGPSQCGKTYWINKLFFHLDEIVEPKIEKIVYLYTTYQPIYDKMKENVEKKNTKIEFLDCNSGIPRANDIQTNLSVNILVLLDDLMTLTSLKENLDNLDNLDNFASRDSHHSNMSAIFTCLNVCYGNGKLRNSRVNSQYTLLVKNMGDRRNMNMLSDNKGLKRSKFNNSLSDIEERTYGHLLFDNCPTSYDNARVRTDIFPSEKTVIYDV